jgi:hypothetical protein
MRQAKLDAQVGDLAGVALLAEREASDPADGPPWRAGVCVTVRGCPDGLAGRVLVVGLSDGRWGTAFIESVHYEVLLTAGLSGPTEECCTLTLVGTGTLVPAGQAMPPPAE